MEDFQKYIHEPFLMMLGGLLLYFAIVWMRGRNRGKYNGPASFWADQKDEMAVAFIAGLLFVVWDSQVLAALDFGLKYFNFRDADAPDLVMHTYYYFIVSPAVELLITGIDKLTSKKESNGKR